MSVPRDLLYLPPDFADRFGRKEAWHGVTHSPEGKPMEDAKGKPKIMRCVWWPESGPSVDELHIIYDDGQTVRVSAENFRRVP